VHRIMFFKVGGRNVHLPKLMGAFVLVAAFLMFCTSVSQMFESWENAKFIDNCLGQASASLSIEDKQTCQQSAYYAGLFVRLDQKALTAKQFLGMILQPIAMMLLWIVVLVFGAMLYLSGKLIIPIEEAERVVKDRVLKRRKK